MTFKDYLILEKFYPSNNLIKYNKTVFFPPNWEIDAKNFLSKLPSLGRTAHLKYDRSYRHDFIINKSDLKIEDIFELQYTQDGLLQKVGFRIRHMDNKVDVTVIVAREGVIVTSWVNDKSDTHRSLNTSTYSRLDLVHAQ